MDNVKVRKAFALAIDRDSLAKFRKTVKPLVDFTPEGIFPKYEEARTKVYTEILTSPERAKIRTSSTASTSGRPESSMPKRPESFWPKPVSPSSRAEAASPARHSRSRR